MYKIWDFKDKHIVITGAGSGIGRETCICLSKLGAIVSMIDINENGLRETLELMDGTCHFLYSFDLTDIKHIPNLAKDVSSTSLPIDGFVHCAGISSRKPLNVLKSDGFSKIMNVNFYSFIELTKHITKKGVFANSGSIVVMSSISSIKGYKAKAEYCVSKAAVDAFVRCMALELAHKKIRINSIMPGEVLTPLGIKGRQMNEQAGVPIIEQPLGPSEPYEIANTIAFLLSDATKTITGTSIVIDGGATI